jgi:hypothetical protein
MNTNCVIREVVIPGRAEPCYVREFDLPGYQRWLEAIVNLSAQNKPAPGKRLVPGKSALPVVEESGSGLSAATEPDLRELALALTWCDADGKLLHPTGKIEGFADKLNGRLLAALYLATAELNCLLPVASTEVEAARDFFTPSQPSSNGTGWRASLGRWMSARSNARRAGGKA